MEFGGLEEKFIREYCEDRLTDKSYTDKIVDFSRLFTTFNFDVLVALVEECNRYGGDLEAMVEIMNAKPEYSGKSNYTTSSVTFGGISAPSAAIEKRKFGFIPSQQDTYVNVRFVVPNSDNNASNILDSLENNLQEDAFDDLISLLEKDEVRFGNYRSYSYNPFGEDVETTYYDICIQCKPESVVFYSNGGGPCYNPGEGVYVYMKKAGKVENKSRFSDYD